MGIKKVVCCDRCGKDINGYEGFSVLGNIHIIDSNHEEGVGGGLVGNNFDPLIGKNHRFAESELAKISYYCRDCFVDVVFGAGYEVKAKQTSEDILFRKSIQNEEKDDSWPLGDMGFR